MCDYRDVLDREFVTGVVPFSVTLRVAAKGAGVAAMYGFVRKHGRVFPV